MMWKRRNLSPRFSSKSITKMKEEGGTTTTDYYSLAVAVVGGGGGIDDATPWKLLLNYSSGCCSSLAGRTVVGWCCWVLRRCGA